MGHKKKDTKEKSDQRSRLMQYYFSNLNLNVVDIVRLDTQLKQELLHHPDLACSVFIIVNEESQSF